ncbi:hypothetical protein Tco_1429471 [Tanacetum coccineum]
MLVEKKYPLRKKVMLQMLELKLESEEDSTMALELIRSIKKLLAKLESEDSDGIDKGLSVASDVLRDEISVIFGLSELKIEEPMTDQPLSAYASPTALSPGYIADSDLEEDKEDPEEDPADHPADG